VVNIERVFCSEGKDAVGRMPSSVKHFATEIENINRNLVFLALVAVADAARFQWLLQFEVTRRLKCDIMLCFTFKESEVVVVRTGQQHSVSQHQQKHSCFPNKSNLVLLTCDQKPPI